MEENIKEKTEKKKHILVNKKIYFMNRFTSNNINQQKNKSITNFQKDKINTIGSIKSHRNRLTNVNINNYQFEIKEKDIIFKNNGDENKKIYEKILSEFNSNNNETNNNIFDEENKKMNNSKDKNSSSLKKENRIQEIEIKNMNWKSNYKTKSYSEFKNKKQLRELDIKDKFYQIDNLNTDINFNNDIINNNSNNISSNINYLNTETIVESVRNRNRPKNISLNNFTYNELFNKSNTYKDFHKTPKNFNRINNNINNINNINNNISLNNRYNFYIKIGKTNGNEKQKNNKKINCEIKLNPQNIKSKDEISSRIIKKLIKNYEIDNINSNSMRKEINVRTKPSFKKLEVQKVLYNNKINKESRNNKNKINLNIQNQKTKNNTHYSFNNTDFKFLVHQAHENRNTRESFNKYFKSNAHKGRSQSNRNNTNNSFSHSNLANNTESEVEIDINNKQNKCNKKFKSFYNIGLTKRNHKFSEKKILKGCNIKSIDIINYNRNINNINLKKNKINKNLNGINNNKNFSQTQRIVYNFDNNAPNEGNKTTNRERHHTKADSSFSTFTLNSNFNSITNLTNTNINLNTNRFLSPTSSKVTNLSICSINLEFLYVLQEKLKLILENLKKSKKCDKASFDFINYYFNHNFANELINLIISSYNQNIIIKFIKIELLCLFLLYDISFEEEIKEIEIILKSIFGLLYKNFLITISFVTSKYKNENNNIIMILNKIVKDNLQNDDLFETYKILDESKYIKLVENHFSKIFDYYDMIVENIYMKKIDENNKISFGECINNINPKILSKNKFEIIISNFFIEAQKKLFEYPFEALKSFFYSFLTSKETFYKNIKSKNKSNSINNSFHYLLPKIHEHKYTLILDLDETLIYSQINFDYKLNNKIILPKTTLIMRPGLHEFLHDMKLLYELIVFSSGSPEYVDPIIKAIEKEEKYFDYVLYRHHMTVDEFGDNVKNLNLIGRNLNSTIIIDDVSKNFKMQKDNGICIRPFVGNCTTDSKTLKTLNNVLQKIRFNADETKDIRISLKKFKYLLYPIVISEKK